MTKHAVERPRHSCEVEGIDEQARVPDLPPTAAAQPTPELVVHRPTLPRGLLLQCPERSEVALSLGDLCHGRDAYGADELVLQVFDAYVEAARLHLGARQVGAEPGSLETSTEVALFSRVTEARKHEIEAVRPVLLEEATDGLRTADRNDRDAFGGKIPTTAGGEGFERNPIADAFDEHNCARSRR